jgi:hypothetical protein
VCVCVCVCEGAARRLRTVDSGQTARARVRISGITLEIVVEDYSVDSGLGDWESLDAINPYAGTSLSASRVEAAMGEANSAVIFRDDGTKHVLSDEEKAELAAEARKLRRDTGAKDASPIGWDVVAQVDVVSVGVSIINARPSEIAYFSCRGVTVRYGVSMWERFFQLLIQQVQLDDMAETAAFAEVLCPLPLEKQQPRLLTVSVFQTLPTLGLAASTVSKELLFRDVFVSISPLIMSLSYDTIMRMARAALRASKRMTDTDDDGTLKSLGLCVFCDDRVMLSVTPRRCDGVQFRVLVGSDGVASD